MMLSALLLGAVCASSAYANVWRGTSETGIWYQLNDGSYPRSQWLRVGGDWYYFDGSGYALTGWHKIKGYWYHFRDNGSMSWGFEEVDGILYNFGDYGDGAMKTGWCYSDPTWYYFDSSGAFVPGRWIQSGSSWWYRWPDGSYPSGGWEYLSTDYSGGWYLFDDAGYMRTGWQFVGGSWYYLGSDGAMRTEWQFVDGSWYWFGFDPIYGGAMGTGWLALPDYSGESFTGLEWYYLGKDGAMRTGWQYLNGAWYHLDSSGRMSTGLKQVDGAKYWFDEISGAMKTGWFVPGDTWGYDGDEPWMYATASGALVANTWIDNYWLNDQGIMERNAWVDGGSSYVGSDGKRVDLAAGFLTEDGFRCKLVKSGEETLVDIVGYEGASTSVYIPDAVNGFDVRSVDVSNCGLTDLYISNRGKFTSIDCSNNNLKYLSLDYGTTIDTFDCSKNELRSLYCHFSAINKLLCQNNKLDSLGSLPTSLVSLNCSWNNLVYFGVSNRETPYLTYVNCSHNGMSDNRKQDLRDGWGSLPGNILIV